MTKPFFGALLSAMMTVLAPAAFAQIPAPAGYAPYCSMLYLNGGWDFKLGQSGGDPCADLSKPGANIARAGLWHVGADASGGGSGSGENNILIRCGGKQPPIPKVPMPLVDRGVGTDFINKTVAKVKAVKGLTNCVVTVAPTALPIFGRPYGPTTAGLTPDADVDKIGVSGFNFDSNFLSWSVTDFGQDPGKKGTAISFDRFGRQEQRAATATECKNNAPPLPAGCFLPQPSRAGSGPECATRGLSPGCVFDDTFEPAYDWTMPLNKPLIAVAPGTVLWAGTRNVPGCGAKDPNQKEIYISHQVGSAPYAETFVTIYFHLNSFVDSTGAQTQTPPAIGTTLSGGQTIGFVGSTGCSGAPHLDFRVVRLSNLGGGYSFNFQVQLTPGSKPVIPPNSTVASSQEGYGSNGLAGHIDPFGWAAPKGMDPWAYRSLGLGGSGFPTGITDFGAFSIDLWKPLQAPPTYWTDFVPVFHQGDPGQGIGGYDLQSPNDQAFAFDFNSTGKLDHLVLYRPGTGTIWILEKDSKGNFKPVFQQGDPGNGIGGYDLLSPDDRVFAFDWNGSGKLDHLALYRPGTGTIWILEKDSKGNFNPVFQQGDPGNGIGGYDLKSPADRVFAFDWNGSGKLDHLALYRPGTGTFWVIQNKPKGTFKPLVQVGDPGNGIGDGKAMYNLKSADDQVLAFDYDGTGKSDHLVLYRPGTGTLWIMRNNQDATFDWVYKQGDPGNGIGGYNLNSANDRGFAFDFDGSGKADHLVLYRPGTGTIWILKRENSG